MPNVITNPRDDTRKTAENAGTATGPLSDPSPLHPTQTVDKSPAYRRADGSRSPKDN